VSYLGRGLENTAGKPFGWAWHQERDEIREHLKRRGRYRPGWSEFEVTRIQQRLHRDKPTFRQRQEAARAAGETWVSPTPKPPPPPSFTRDELERMVEHFAGSNDAVGASIASKARELIDRG
jgi:hypothetical protein